MKNSLLTLCILFLASISYAQQEGQDFCNGNPEGSYFPLDIKKKKLVWSGTGYIEAKGKSKTIAGKKFTEYKQTWENGEIGTLYLREENGVIYQGMPKTGIEFIRYDPSFKKGHKWSGGAYFVSFKIKSTKGKLTTPFCKYTNLLVIKGTYDTGETYNFYYLRGYGYVGATNKKGVVSFVSPL